MAAGSTWKTDEARGSPSWRKLGLLVPGIALAMSLFVVFVFQLSRAQTEFEVAMARNIEAEDGAFCTRFSAGPETPRYAECAAALSDVRARHSQRNTSLLP